MKASKRSQAFITPLKGCNMEQFVIIIGKLSECVCKNGQHLLKIKKNVPKWEVNDLKKCHVKFPIHQWQSFAIKSVVSDIAVYPKTLIIQFD